MQARLYTPLRDTQMTDQVQNGMPRSVKLVALNEPAREPVTCQPFFEARVARTTPEEPVKIGKSQCAAFDDAAPAPPQNAHASSDPAN